MVLIERNTRQVAMTEVGLTVVEQARQALAAARAVKEVASTFHDPMKGSLQVGLIPTVAPYLLPNIMPTLRSQFPQLKLWLHEQQTAVLLEKLRRAELDLLILALPVETDEFAEIDLFNESFVLAVSREHELAQKSHAQLSDLQGREVLLLEQGHCLRGQALDVCFSAGASGYQGFRATSLETLRHMVAEGMGMTLLPELAVPKLPSDSDPIRYLPFIDPKPQRRIGMLYRKGSYRQFTFVEIARVIRERMAAWVETP